MPERQETRLPENHQANWYPPWAPRFWNGMRMLDYWRLLACQSVSNPSNTAADGRYGRLLYSD